MRQIDSMFRDPFGDMGGQMALPDARDHHRDRRNRQRSQQQAQNMVVGNRGGFMDPFAHFDSMFSNMRSMMGQMHQAFVSMSIDL